MNVLGHLDRLHNSVVDLSLSEGKIYKYRESTKLFSQLNNPQEKCLCKQFHLFSSFSSVNRSPIRVQKSSHKIHSAWRTWDKPRPIIRFRRKKFPFQYLGQWYEVYRSNVVFEIGSKCVNATYTANPDGSVGVWNQELNWLDDYLSIHGNARVKNASEPAAFIVTFDNPSEIDRDRHSKMKHRSRFQFNKEVTTSSPVTTTATR